MSKQAMSLGAVFSKFSKVWGLAGLMTPIVLLAGNAAAQDLTSPPSQTPFILEQQPQDLTPTLTQTPLFLEQTQLNPQAATPQMGAPQMGLGHAAPAQSGREAGSDRAIRLVTLAPVPVATRTNHTGGMYSFDISFVDQVTQMYYLGDRSNAAVDVVDAKTGTFVTQFFAGFAGVGSSPDTSGPNGVVAATIGRNSFLFVTDANSRVVSMNAKTGAVISDVRTAASDPLRADELAFDPRDNLLLVINNADTPPFGTFIKVDPATGVLTPPAAADRLTFDALHGIDAQHGAEQPVWEPDTGRFYLSIPQIGPSPAHIADGGVVRINPISKSVEATIPVRLCSPAGLTVGPRQDLFVGCNMVFDTEGNVWSPTGTVPADPRDVIIDAKTGKKDPTALDANVFGVGAGDEVWYNAGDGNYYATGSGSPMRPLPFPMPPAAGVGAQGTTPLGVVDARDQRILQLVSTFNVPAATGTNAHPSGTSHSVAANANNNLVFVPLPANNVFLTSDGSKNCLTGCIAVFGHPDEDVK